MFRAKKKKVAAKGKIFRWTRTENTKNAAPFTPESFLVCLNNK